MKSIFIILVICLINQPHWVFVSCYPYDDVSSQRNIPPSELSALEDIYADTNGETWNWHGENGRWNFSGDPNPCLGWQGINCTLPNNESIYLHVYTLKLENYGMKGSIPDSISALRRISLIDLGDNMLTGTIPSTLSSLLNLTIFNVSSNNLHGCLPIFNEQLAALQLSYNGFSCGLESLTTQQELSFIDIAHNRFTGKFPNDLFKLPNLRALVGGVNCFSGTINAEDCNLPEATDIILDGLHTAPHCRRYIWESWKLTDAFFVKRGVKGTLPNCLVKLPKLTTLHMSGNGFTGTLPALSAASPLSKVIFSYNELTGTIPDSYQTHNWSYIDLSYNRLSGDLSHAFGKALPASTTVHLVNNRLSGEIPPGLKHIQDISILGTNMFACGALKKEIPPNDGEKLGYNCGSTGFDAIYFLFLIAVAVLVGSSCWLRWSPIPCARLKRASMLREMWRLPKGSLPKHCQHLYTMVEILCQVGVYCTVPILLVLLPWYIVASHYWGTYSYTYAWTVSAAFIAGFAPGLVEFFLFTLLMIVLIVLVAVVAVRTKKEDQLFVERAPSHTSASRKRTAIPLYQRAVIYFCYVLFNCTIVSLANAGLALADKTNSSALVYLAGFFLSLFKFFWNSWMVPRLVEWASTRTGERDNSAGFFTVQVFIGLFNNIAIPCMVVAVLSDNCFTAIFSNSQEISSELVYHCPHADVCDDTVLMLSYNSPFEYDYQCSSSLITSYAATFTFLSITAGVGTPLITAIIINILPATIDPDIDDQPGRQPKVHSTLVESEAVSSSSSSSSSSPSPSPHQSHVIEDIGSRTIKVNRSAPNQSSFLYRVVLKLSPRVLKPIKLRRSGTHVNESDSRMSLIGANNLLVALIIYLGILLTFGAVFPPLAVAMGFTMLSVAWQAKVKIGRLLYNAKEAGAHFVRDEVENECKEIASLSKLRGGLLMILLFGYSFYALFVFDTIGVEERLDKAYWALIVMPLTPVGLYVGLNVYRRYRFSASGEARMTFRQDMRATVQLAHPVPQSLHRIPTIVSSSATTPQLHQDSLESDFGTVNIMMIRRQSSV